MCLQGDCCSCSTRLVCWQHQRCCNGNAYKRWRADMLLPIMQHGAACIRCLKKGCCRHKCSLGNLQCMLLAFSILGLEVLQCDMEAVHVLLRPLVECMQLCSIM